MERQEQSMIDVLIRMMPSLKDEIAKKKDYVDQYAAKNLFNIWRTSSNKVGERKYKRPPTVSLVDVEGMQKEGLIRSIGDRIEITDKGAKVIKIMILGDDRSSFEDNNIVIDYSTALSNVKDVKVAKTQKSANDWWSRFTK